MSTQIFFYISAWVRKLFLICKEIVIIFVKIFRKFAGFFDVRKMLISDLFDPKRFCLFFDLFSCPRPKYPSVYAFHGLSDGNLSVWSFEKSLFLKFLLKTRYLRFNYRIGLCSGNYLFVLPFCCSKVTWLVRFWKRSRLTWGNITSSSAKTTTHPPSSYTHQQRHLATRSLLPRTKW